VRARKTTALASRRSESSRRAILDAALALCREEGYARLSIEAIAARAGVGKQTIYRWWPSKGAVLLEALEHEAAGGTAYPDTGDLIADMRITINDIAGLQAGPDVGRPLAALIAEAQQDPTLGHLLLERFIRPRRAPIADRLRRAQQAGQLPETLDVDALLEVILGALYHRLLLPSGPLDAAYANFVVDTVFAGTSTVRPNTGDQGTTAPAHTHA
jgi:AcrR family transcriptional regulator